MKPLKPPLKPQTYKLLDALEEVASEGNYFAEAMMLHILNADDPDAEAEHFWSRLRESARRLGRWARSYPTIIEQTQFAKPRLAKPRLAKPRLAKPRLEEDGR